MACKPFAAGGPRSAACSRLLPPCSDRLPSAAPLRRPAAAGAAALRVRCRRQRMRRLRRAPQPPQLPAAPPPARRRPTPPPSPLLHPRCSGRSRQHAEALLSLPRCALLQRRLPKGGLARRPRCRVRLAGGAVGGAAAHAAAQPAAAASDDAAPRCVGGSRRRGRGRGSAVGPPCVIGLLRDASRGAAPPPTTAHAPPPQQFAGGCGGGCLVQNPVLSPEPCGRAPRRSAW